jgi:hypothetical protein
MPDLSTRTMISSQVPSHKGTCEDWRVNGGGEGEGMWLMGFIYI